MLLVIDVGNTNIVLGLFRGTELLENWRVNTLRERTSDEYGILFRSLLSSRGIEPNDVEDVITSTVVPPMNYVLERTCSRYFGKKPLQVGPGLKTGMPILYENPREVGADRIVNAVAAFEEYGSGGIVVDFGTATTFDAISHKGEYLGGAIAPGAGIGAEALFQRASKLPRVGMEKPPQVIGRNTVHSIQSGLFFGYVGLVEEIVLRMKAEIVAYAEKDGVKSDAFFVIATGGLGHLIASESKTVEKVSENLTLEGLRLLYEKNRRR